MANTNIPKLSARFETTLALGISKGASSFTVASGTDKAGNALSGIYGFVIDNGLATEEFVIGTISGTTVSSVASGLDPANPQTTVVALQQAHRKGASVKITDYPILAYLRETLNGNAAYPIDNVLSYTTEPTFNNRKQIIDKGYADDVIVGLVPTGSPSTAGTVKTTTSNSTVASTDDARFTPDNTDIAFGSGNKPVSQTGLQKQAENYAADSGSANAYAVTLAPVPTSYAAGMIVRFKAANANTTVSTLNVNSLGTKTIKKVDGATDLVANDIKSGQLVVCVYDGTNFQMVSPIGQTLVQSFIGTPVSDSASTVKNTDTVYTTAFTPKAITVYYTIDGVNNVTAQFSVGIATWDGVTLQSNFALLNNAVAGNITQATPTIVNTAPTAGANAGGSSIVVTLSIINVTATGFTVRIAYTVAAGSTGHAKFYAVATQ